MTDNLLPLPPINPFYSPRLREYTLSLDYGLAVFRIPGRLSAEDVQDLEDLFALIIRQSKRLAAADAKNWLLTEKISLLKELP